MDKQYWLTAQDHPFKNERRSIWTHFADKFSIRRQKPHQLLSHLERGNEPRCSFNGSLPVHAKLATAWFEATGQHQL